jgi:hypothetical protein
MCPSMTKNLQRLPLFVLKANKFPKSHFMVNGVLDYNHSLSSHLAFKVFGEGLLFPSAQGESRQLKKSKVIFIHFSIDKRHLLQN